jgi:cytochrome c biogenesis factor
MGHKMDLMSREYVTTLMRRQFLLSASIAAVFVTIIAVVPLLNRYLPEVMEAEFLGMTVSWFFLGFAIFPILIALAWVFVVKSNAFEDEAIGMVDSSTLPKRDEPAAGSAGLGRRGD